MDLSLRAADVSLVPNDVAGSRSHYQNLLREYP